MENLLAQAPENQDLSRALAILYRKTGRYFDAICLWQQISINRSDDHLNYGTALAGARNERAAVHEYHEALRLCPTYYLAWHNLGNALRRRKRFRAALGVFNKALGLQPDSPELYNCIGLTREAAGDFESAAAAYRKGLEYSPGYTDCARNLSKLMADQGDRTGAIRELELALQQNPDSRAIHELLAELWKQEGRTDLSELHSERAARGLDDFNPEFPEDRARESIFSSQKPRAREEGRTSRALNRAFACVESGNIEEAIEEFDDAEVDGNISAEAYRDFALIMIKHGYIARAYSYAANARRLEPGIQLNNVLENVLRDFPRMIDEWGIPDPKRVL
jgi:tetratricopeptide (TPR) repeat protein